MSLPLKVTFSIISISIIYKSIKYIYNKYITPITKTKYNEDELKFCIDFPIVYNYFKSNKTDNIISLISNTPIIKSEYLSNQTGLNVYIKLENMLPFTSKDRIVMNIIFQAIRRGEINKETVLYEGSSGSTCYSVAMIGNILGLRSKLIIPDDISNEKLSLLKSTKAELVITKQCPYSNFNNNYVRLAKKLCMEDPKGFYINQFENEDNYNMHLTSTAHEIFTFFHKRKLYINCLVSGSGTGGTISGLSNFLKMKYPNLKVFLSDVAGSGLYSYVKNGVIFTNEESEANRKKYRYYTKIEGIGINFLTNNFLKAKIDDAIKVSDEEAIQAARNVYLHDGIFGGGSSGVNFAAVLKLKDCLPEGSNVLTIMYDSGLKYLKKLYSDEDQLNVE